MKNTFKFHYFIIFDCIIELNLIKITLISILYNKIRFTTDMHNLSFRNRCILSVPLHRTSMRSFSLIFMKCITMFHLNIIFIITMDSEEFWRYCCSWTSFKIIKIKWKYSERMKRSIEDSEIFGCIQMYVMFVFWRNRAILEEQKKYVLTFVLKYFKNQPRKPWKLFIL